MQYITLFFIIPYLTISCVAIYLAFNCKKKCTEQKFCRKKFYKLTIQEFDDDDSYPVILIRIFKNQLQYAIGIGIFVIVFFKMYEIVNISFDPNAMGSWFHNLWDKYNSESILKIVSIGLGAATAIELAYMLFTPGPDEAVQPVMMGVASAVLYALSDIDNLKGIEIIGIALLICTLPLLFVLNKKLEEWQEQKRKRNNK